MTVEQLCKCTKKPHGIVHFMWGYCMGYGLYLNKAVKIRKVLANRALRLARGNPSLCVAVLQLGKSPSAVQTLRHPEHRVPTGQAGPPHRQNFLPELSSDRATPQCVAGCSDTSFFAPFKNTRLNACRERFCLFTSSPKQRGNRAG